MNGKKIIFTAIFLGIFILLSLVVADDIIVETREGGQNINYYRELTGNWTNSVAKSEARGVTKGIGSRFCDYHPDNFSPRALVSPSFPRSGVYEVFVTWSQSANLRNIKYIINYANGQTTITLDQDGWGGLSSPNRNQWISLGKYQFSRGTGNNLQIDGSEATGGADDRNFPRIYTDAFRFLYQPDGEATAVAERQPEPERRPVQVETRDDVALRWHRNLNDARSIARQENRNILIYFYTPQAQVSREYDRYFEQSEFQSKLRNYVLVRIDLSANPQYSSEYSIFRVPAIVFTNSRGTETSRITRPLSRAELLERL